MSFVQDGTIAGKDLGQFGVIELTVKGDNPQTLALDDPGETIALRQVGTEVVVEKFTNSANRMGDLQAAAEKAFGTFSQGVQDLGQQPGQQGDSPGTPTQLDTFLPPIIPISIGGPPPAPTPASNPPAQNAVQQAPTDVLIVPTLPSNTAPLSAPDVTLASDSGTSDNDHITNMGSLALSNLSNGASVSYSTDNGASWSNSFTPVEGLNTLLVRQTDAAGNTSPVTTFSFILDTEAPATITGLDLAAADDSFGSGTAGSNHDHLTKSTSGLTINGVGENDALVTLFDDVNDDGVQQGGEATLGTATVSGGSFSANISLSEGLHHVSAYQTDLAGNASTVTTLDITVDTTALPPGALALAADDDSFGAGTAGTDHDHLTKNTSGLTISGTGEDSAFVTLFDDANNDGVQQGGEATLATSTVIGGSFSTDITLTEGLHHVAAYQTDAAGNVSQTTTLDIVVDTTVPTVAVDLAETSLNGGHTSSQVTFTFSEAPGPSFGLGDISVVGGSLSDLTATADPLVYSATFTADDGFSGTGSVTVNSGSYSDAAGNTGNAGADTVAIDRVNPTVVVDIADASLSDGRTSSQVTFTFSEAPGASFGLGDISVVGGSLSGLTATANPLVFTATFTATDGFSGTGSVAVNNGSYSDAAGNIGSAGADTVAIDRGNPTVSVNIVDTLLSDGDTSSQVTFTFSEAPVGFTAADIAAIGGTISGLTATADPLVYTATFTATDNISGTGLVGVFAGSYSDAAGNTGSAGSDTVAIDRVNPTVAVDITDASLSEGHASSQVTFTFSEAPIGFALADISATHGTISNLVKDDATHFHATFTAEDSFEGQGSVTVAANTFTDAALNPNAASASDTVAIDTEDPPLLQLGGGTVVLDQFTTQSYGSWTETNDNYNAQNSSPTAGEFTLAHDPLATTGNFQIRLSDLDSEVGVPDLLSHTIDLSGATAAKLTFDYRRDIPSGQADDQFLVLASKDGVHFTQIGQIGVPGNTVGTVSVVDGTYQKFTFDLTPYMSANTTIRFSVGDNVDNGDVVWINNINIASTSPSPTKDFTSTYIEKGTPAPISVSTKITDTDDVDMQSATVILTNKHVGDFFAISGNAVANGSTGSIGAIAYSVIDNGTSISIALTGSASIAAYQTAIATITFASSSDDPSTDARRIDVTVNDGTHSSSTATSTINVVAINDGSADPIILDLGASGVSFSPLHDGVLFDINGDGSPDQVAWTKGEDGILAYDADGSGSIEDGTEIFSADFAGGHHASALAALASLDTNGDGVLDSADPGFGNLRVWQDLNHDGVSEAGELTSLADHAITAVDVHAMPTTSTIDGQQVLSHGTFHYLDGTSGDFAEVALETAYGAPPQPVASQGAEILTDSAASNTFRFLYTADSSPHGPDTIVDFHHGDKIDVSAIDANSSTVSQDAFAFVSTSTPGVQAQSLTWHHDAAASMTVVQGDVDGNIATAELEIHLTGHISLTASDFIIHA
ncbi:MAG: hypothetical protein IT537_18865 [Hyphomicrobiales bacterium]|nr:hypothetical protein [Hyphomicrobiales bacterium]